jgi:hypothetical protein
MSSTSNTSTYFSRPLHVARVSAREACVCTFIAFAMQCNVVARHKPRTPVWQRDRDSLSELPNKRFNIASDSVVAVVQQLSAVAQLGFGCFPHRAVCRAFVLTFRHQNLRLAGVYLRPFEARRSDQAPRGFDIRARSTLGRATCGRISASEAFHLQPQCVHPLRSTRPPVRLMRASSTTICASRLANFVL